MRSVVYYPHTEIKTPDFVKAALLLWDEVEYIVPYADYRPEYTDRRMAEAVEFIGRPHVPTDGELEAAHAVIRDFATGPLPACFFRREPKDAPRDAENDFEIWPQKLSAETWKLLKELAIARDVGEPDPVTTQPAGLAIMSLLADCCAGKTKGRVTDRGDAYSAISEMLALPAPAKEATADVVVSLALPMIDAANLDIGKLMKMRRRESGSGNSARLNYLEHLQSHAVELTKNGQSKRDVAEIRRQFESDSRKDLAELAEELRLARREALTTKEVLVAAVVAVGSASAALHGFALPLPPDVTAPVGLVSTGGGLLNAATKFGKSRREILKKHPLAYIYQASGRAGLRSNCPRGCPRPSSPNRLPWFDRADPRPVAGVIKH
jgi:hypothetical protein